MTRKISLKTQIEKSMVSRGNRNVFLRRDFASLGDYDQVGRALLSLTREGKLIRIGYGLYARARTNRITQTPMLSASGGFDQVVKEALTRLKVKWQPNSAEQQYKNGGVQIPVNAQVSIKGRFSRKISTNRFKLRVQRN